MSKLPERRRIGKLIYFHTYMPPTFLSRRSLSSTISSYNGINDGGDDHVCELNEISPEKEEEIGIGKSCDATKRNIMAEEISSSSSCTNTRIIDLKGSTFDELLHVINSELRCSENDDSAGEKRQQNKSKKVFVATPPLSDDTTTGDGGRRKHFSSNDGCSIDEGFECRLRHRFSPHLTTEDFPQYSGSLESLYYDMNIAIYEITCL